MSVDYENMPIEKRIERVELRLNVRLFMSTVKEWNDMINKFTQLKSFVFYLPHDNNTIVRNLAIFYSPRFNIEAKSLGDWIQFTLTKK